MRPGERLLQVVEEDLANVHVRAGHPTAARRVKDVVLGRAAPGAREVVVDQPAAGEVELLKLVVGADLAHLGIDDRRDRTP